VVVHKYLSSQGMSGASTANILQFYRSEASALPRELKKAQLSDLALPRVLIGLVEKRIIEQIDANVYRINIADAQVRNLRDSLMGEMLPRMSGMFGMQDDMVRDRSIRNRVYSIIGNASYIHNENDLSLKLVEEGDAKSSEEVRAFLAVEIASERLRKDSKGRIGFGVMAESEDP
jgi:hypothetical protein